MEIKFPTFRRWLSILAAAVGLRPPGMNWSKQRSLLRLILVAVEENLSVSPLLAAWAADETGGQRDRVYRLAQLLASGTPLPDAVEEVRGVLGEEDILAIRFGAQSGTLAASIRERLDEPNPVSSGITPRLRKVLYYYFLLLVIGSFIVTFLQIKIVPEFNKILEEFDVREPASLYWSRIFSQFIVNYWYLFAVVIMAICWLAFSSLPGRRLRLAILSRLYRPLRELRTADVLEKLGVAIQAGRPVTGAVSTLARYHYDPMLRRQLLFVRNEMEHGADLWQSMKSLGLLSPPEARVMATAGRLGNRPWVLKQIALVKKRRTMRRLVRFSELVLPIVIVLMGMFVLLQALSVFAPMVQIIYSLL